MLYLSQPRGFYTITLGELCERFSYYGAQTLLVLYLTQHFLVSDNISYSIYGGYAAFAYALPVLGGLLADRLLAPKPVLITGGLLLIIGNLLMAFPSLTIFCIGLALTACGTGLYKPNSASLISQLYGSNAIGAKRESGFTLFYMGMNIGAMASPFVYGFMEKKGFQYAYLISAALLTISWLLFIVRHYHTLPTKKINWLNQSLGHGLIIAGSIIVALLFLNPTLLNNFLILFGLIALIALLIVTFRREKIERNHFLAILLLCFFCMCFFAASLQVGSSINLFIQRDVNSTIGNWPIPAIMFTSLYPLAVILLAPIAAYIWTVLTKRNFELPAPIKISIGLILGSIGFLCFMLSAWHSSKALFSYIPITWILLGNLALGAGELCLMPTMLSLITRLSPVDLQSTMIGVLFLFIAFGGYLSGIAGKISDYTIQNINLSGSMYGLMFFKFSIILLIIAIFAFILTPIIKFLMR